MNNISKLILSLLMTLPLSSLCYSKNVTLVCPDTQLLQTTTVGYIAYQKPNEPVTVMSNINKYNTQQFWSMNFTVSSGNLDNAISKAKKSLQSLRFDHGPHYYHGKWICTYDVNEPGVLKVSAETNSAA